MGKSLVALTKVLIEKPCSVHVLHDGTWTHVHFVFPNGYTASVIKDPFRSGIEMAILHDDMLISNSIIGGDVVARFDPIALSAALREVADLPKE